MLQPLLIDGRPHWESRFPKEVWPFFEDFRNALVVIWDHLGLPFPTDAQLEIACRLQYGADSHEWTHLTDEAREAFLNDPRLDIIRAYRGIGKSYITSAFCAWRLGRNPRDEKILIVSATATKSKAFVSQLKAVLGTLELLKFLVNGRRDRGEERRDQADQFDVSGSSLSQDYSVVARAILGQITGSRATLIVADDIEIIQNSATEEAREKIILVCREFDSIAKTEHGRGDVFFLGTPQTEESVYNKMVIEQGFRCFTIPVKYPELGKMGNYVLTTMDDDKVDILAPFLKARHEAGKLRSGQLTDPARFSTDELIKFESRGKAYFALQMMLDTSLSDAERYPLKQHDLIVFAANPDRAPLTIQWGHHTDGKNRIHGVANVGFTGDHFLRPLMVDTEWNPYDGSVLFVDPAGRGKDETAWAIIKTLNGVMYLCGVGGLRGDPEKAMFQIAMDAKLHNVSIIEVEPNYGGGMWVTAFGPVLSEVWPGGCTVQESAWAKGQKETRIIDTLEPVMTRHRLVVDESVIRAEASKIGEELSYSLLYQLTHITRDRGALKHDDRLDAVAGAVAHFQHTAGQDMNEAAEAVLNARMDDEIEDFIEIMTTGFSFGRGRTLGPRRGGVRDEVIILRR